MVPEDEPAPPAKPRTHPAGNLEDDAFAATIAPASVGAGNPTPPAAMPVGSAAPADDATLMAPSSSGPAPEGAVVEDGLPPLPIVPASNYKPDREIARGGMGRIVAAEDQRLGRPVALKELLEPAGDQLARFQREALITARLQHHGIVPVYEAGRWPTGEPFFSMKLVSGRPLDRVIADARTLDERLALLPRIAAAADAIAYAHSKRIVHRDLKPANVLIGDYGETVVIDWGLAKDLDAGDGFDSATRTRARRGRARTNPSTPSAKTAERSLPQRDDDDEPRSPSATAGSTLTVAGAVMGTPAYMAPEQARGEPVDARADVFALGAMLYHLLAGVPPYNARTATDVIAAAALGKVVPLDERERRAPRELVAIVERAMAQLPDDRYPHAGELADELRRFMTGKLVSAHRYTAFQRVARFVKRHRAAVTIATIAVIGFAVGGTLAVTRIVHERDNADRERTLAVTRQKAAEKLIDEMLNDMKDRLATIGRLDLLASLGGEVRDYYSTLSKIPGGMPIEDVDRMAIAVDLVGKAERDSGQSDRAYKTWTEARARLAGVVGLDTSAASRFKRMMIARLDHELGTIHQLRGKGPAAVAAYQKARAEYTVLRAEAPKERLILLGAAENHDRLGDLLRNDGKIDLAFEEYSAAKTEREAASSQASSKPSEEVLALSTSHLKLGSIYQARGDSATALGEYSAALRLRTSVLEGQPDNVQVQEKMLEVQDALAELHRLIGDAKSAGETYAAAVMVIDGLVRRDPANTDWKRKRGNLLADLGFTLLDSGDFKGGIAQLERAIEAQKELVARDPKTATWSIELSQSYTRIGDGQTYLGGLDDALASFGAALEIRARLLKGSPKNAPYRRSVAWAHTKLAGVYTYKLDPERAIAEHEQALILRSALAAESPAHIGFKNELASTEVSLARLLVARDPKRAGELVSHGVERARALVQGDAISNEWKRTLVQGLLAQADVARATGDVATRRTAIAEALALSTSAAERAPTNVHWPCFVAEAHVAAAELATAQGERATAAASWKAALQQLEPLAKAGRLPAPRKVLLDRARAGR